MQKILLVDDCAEHRTALRLALTGADYELLEAQDGPELLAMLEPEQHVGLLILDPNALGGAGFELLEGLRRQAGRAPAWKLLLMANEARADWLARGKQAGAAGWLIKPCGTDLLRAAVGKLAA